MPPPSALVQVRPAEAPKGLAMAPSPVKPDATASPKPAPSVDPSAGVLAPAPSKPARPPMNPLPKGFRPRIEDGIHESGWPRVIVADRDDAPMVLIPEGTFIMGSNVGPAAEAPAHRVRLRAYYIDQHEVTIGQFDKFLDKGYRPMLPPKWAPGDGKVRQENPAFPVTMVTFKDAEAYAEWANRQLPTEAQWEMAARSTVSNIYPWGNETIAWEKPRAHHQVEPVMSFPQDVSAAGTFDMAGNVAEWTRDWFDAKYFQQYSDGLSTEPTGPLRGSRTLQRAIKGGSKTWHLSHREGMPQEKRLAYVGFRCVLNLNSAPSAAPGGQPAAPARPNLAPIPF